MTILTITVTVTANSWSKMPAIYAIHVQLASKRKKIKENHAFFKEGFTEVPRTTST